MNAALACRLLYTQHQGQMPGTKEGNMHIGHEMLYLSRADIEAINLPMAEIMDTLERAYIEKAEGRLDMPPKLGISPAPEAFAHAMPCWLPAMNAAGMKWVGGTPANKAKGLPFLGGLCVLNDPESCMPVCIMDCGWITAKRTGAKSGICARHFARRDSRVLGILGCGAQGYSNLEAMSLALPALEQVLVYNTSPEPAERLAASQSEKLGIPVRAMHSPREVVEESDVLVSAGWISPSARRTIEAGWIKAGATLVPVDLDCMYTAEAMTLCDKYFTDDLSVYDHFRKLGFFSTVPERPGEFCQALAGHIPGRENDIERIITLSNGLALDDVSTARRIFELALDTGKGMMLPV